MSDLVIGRDQAPAFRPLTITLMLVIGVVGFLGAVLLGAYAPQLRSSSNGGAHALSKSAVGFAGIVALAADTGRHPRIIRNERGWVGAQLVVATPERASVPVGGLLEKREFKTTLLILPKWDTAKDASHRGWVDFKGLLDVSEPQGVLAPAQQFTITRHPSGAAALTSLAPLPSSIRFFTPRPLQVITDYRVRDAAGDDDLQEPFVPLISDGNGGTVLAQLGNLYVLADPDLLDNVGMADKRNAVAALALLDWLNRDHPASIGCDVTLNGIGGARNPLTLAFDPPFLAMTLAIAVVLLLLALRAFMRFGAARPRERAIAFGKTALIDNSATLVAKAHRARRLGTRYTEVIRERAVKAFGVSSRLKGSAVDAYLDNLDGGRFTSLAEAAASAKDDATMLAAAQALHDWQGDKRT